MALAEKKDGFCGVFGGGIMGTELGEGGSLKAKGTVAESGKLAGIFL
jgi:hypothetical protein